MVNHFTRVESLFYYIYFSSSKRFTFAFLNRTSLRCRRQVNSSGRREFSGCKNKVNGPFSLQQHNYFVFPARLFVLLFDFIICCLAFPAIGPHGTGTLRRSLSKRPRTLSDKATKLMTVDDYHDSDDFGSFPSFSLGHQFVVVVANTIKRNWP